MQNNNSEVLNLTFKISNSIEYELDNENIVTILIKQDHVIQKFFRKLKFNIPEYKRLMLDEYGSFVFLKIDGENTIKDIANELELKFGEECYPLYERLLLYLNHIHMKRNFIEIV